MDLPQELFDIIYNFSTPDGLIREFEIKRTQNNAETNRIEINKNSNFSKLISKNTKFLKIDAYSTGTGVSIDIDTEFVSLFIDFHNDNFEDNWIGVLDENDDDDYAEDWIKFDKILENIMPKIIKLLKKLNLKLLYIVYDVEDEYLGEIFLPKFFKNFKPNYPIILNTRGNTVDLFNIENEEIQEIINELEPEFLQSIYAPCAECEKYYTIYDNHRK